MVYPNWDFGFSPLISLTISYRQVIKAYPQGGGAYMVTSENLSPKFGLIAGGSLLVDYMLTVAVSVAAGADAITSAIPLLHPYNLQISIILVLVLMVLNLRGMRESAKSLMVPVYLFIASTLFLLGYGFLQILTGHMPYAATAHLGQPITGVSVILILRAFTSGSASLTGWKLSLMQCLSLRNLSLKMRHQPSLSCQVFWELCLLELPFLTGGLVLHLIQV